MNAQTQIVPPTDGELALFQAYTPLAVLTDEKVYSEFYQKLRDLVDAQEPDVSTLKGRKAIASLAAKVARTKTAIDDAGKKLNEDARAQINAVDASRRTIREQLDDLKVEARKPLTDWEEAETAREAEVIAQLQAIRDMGRVDFIDTAGDVQSRLAELDAMEIQPDVHRDGLSIAEAAKAEAIESLTTAHERMVREEQERAELAKLRAAEAARQEREAAEAAERERIAAEKRAAEEAEAQRIAAEKAAAEREARLQKEAEERARATAERKAQEEREATERAHAEALAAERRRAEEAERAAQADRDRIAKEEADRKAAADRAAAEQAAREKNRAHRGKIMAAAKEAIMEAGPVEEPIARAIVLAIAAGSVPAITIQF